MTRVNFLTTFEPVFKVFALFLTLIFVVPLEAQNDTISFWDRSEEVDLQRRNLVLWGEGIGGAAIMGGLAVTWYSDYSAQSFRFFDDSPEWMGMDKIGHGITAYYIASYTSELSQWAGLKPSKGKVLGTVYSLSFLSIVEVLDGFSAGWGFSTADMLTNVAGVGFYYLNSSLLPRQPIELKYSMVPSKYRQYRPELLGENALTALIKDYNAQTYWLSFNMNQFISKKLPLWLALGVGYGADGMLGGRENPAFDSRGNVLPTFDRYAQFYISPDIQWDKIKSRYPFVRGVLKALTFVKLPLPGLELNGKGQFNWRWLI